MPFEHGDLPDVRPGQGLGDPGAMRISDADRQRVAEVLREAAGEGRIDLVELDQRLDATFAAKTYADLVPITADLPAHPGAVLPAPLPAMTAGRADLPTWSTSVAVMGSTKRRGVWLVPERPAAFALMGDVVLDLREAVLPPGGVTVNAVAIMGEVSVLVGAAERVHVSGVPIMGDFSEARPKVAPAYDATSPLVQVKGMALMGSVVVRRLPPPGTPKWLGRTH